MHEEVQHTECWEYPLTKSKYWLFKEQVNMGLCGLLSVKLFDDGTFFPFNSFCILFDFPRPFPDCVKTNTKTCVELRWDDLSAQIISSVSSALMPSSLKESKEEFWHPEPLIRKDWSMISSPTQKTASLVFSSKRKTWNSRDSWTMRITLRGKEWDLVNCHDTLFRPL